MAEASVITDEMRAAIEGLLGPDRPLTFLSHGQRVEAQLLEKPGREWLLALINGAQGEAAVEVGLALPPGSYRVSMLSSTAPDEERSARIAGRGELTDKDLASFAVRLGKEEVLVLRVAAAGAR